jgi:hypothetical protein
MNSLGPHNQLPKKRGRKSNAEKAAIAAAQEKPRTEAEILKDTTDRMDILYKLATATTEGTCPALVVAGAPGVGKTHNITRALEGAKSINDALKFEIIRGMISPINLYKKLFEFRETGNVLVLDDTDGIFKDEDGINLLKAALDSATERQIHYLVDNPELEAKGIGKSFCTKGSVIFITNTDFERYIKLSGKNSVAQHMMALMSRVLYLDLKLHTRRELLAWVKHSVKVHGILKQMGFNDWDQTAIMQWFDTHGDKMYTISIREVLKLGQLFRANSMGWKRDAELLLCR